MAMKPFDQQTQAWSVSYDKVAGMSQISRVVSRRTLGSIVTKVGDYHTPNNHAYVSTRYRGYTGTRQTYVGGTLQNSTSGAQPYVYNYATFLPPTYDSSALYMALSEAYEKLRGNVDLSVDLVQWRQTLKMVSLYRRLVSGIAKSAFSLIPKIDKVKSLQRDLTDPQLGKRRARRLTRELNRGVNALARARLEYTYGWSPTMGTIYDLAQEALNPPGGGLLICEGKGKRISQYVVQQFSPSSKVPTMHNVRVSDRARVKLLYNPPQSVMTQLSKISSLNPVSVLYEAFPFSFVLDWAVDIGGWIRILETAFVHRNEFVTGDQTLTQRCSVGSTCGGADYTSAAELRNGNFTAWALRGEAVRTKLTRTGLSSPPFPVNPMKQFEFGVGRQLNALALAKVVLLDADRLIAGKRK